MDTENKNHSHPIDPRIEAFEELKKKRDSVFARFPLPFTLLGAFGLVATNYGFTHLIDKVPVFVRNPFIILLTGLTILVITGTLYKKLD